MEDITASDKQDFVESLPEIQADEKFCFDCHALMSEILQRLFLGVTANPGGNIPFFTAS